MMQQEHSSKPPPILTNSINRSEGLDYIGEKTQVLLVSVLPTQAVQTKDAPEVMQLLQPGPAACVQVGQDVPLMILPAGQVTQSLLVLPVQVRH